MTLLRALFNARQLCKLNVPVPLFIWAFQGP